MVLLGSHSSHCIWQGMVSGCPGELSHAHLGVRGPGPPGYKGVNTQAGLQGGRRGTHRTGDRAEGTWYSSPVRPQQDWTQQSFSCHWGGPHVTVPGKEDVGGPAGVSTACA